VEDILLAAPILRYADAVEFAGSYRRWRDHCRAFRRDLCIVNGISGEMMLTGTIVLAVIAFVLTILEERHRLIERITSAPAWIQIPAYAIVCLSLELFSVTEEKIPFIYFQF